MVGRVPLYLLDTNLEENDPRTGSCSASSTAAGPDLRLRQEWILGVGGVRVLRAVGIDPGVWHANEGHAAFMLVERLRELIADGHDLRRRPSSRSARTSVFTTHTPVPAGHDAFAVEQLAQCTGPVWEEMGVNAGRVLRSGPPSGRDHGNAST